jgi:hypothetical protein
MMLRAIVDIVGRNRKLIILTFEIFWILVFILNRVAGNVPDVPEFVYVNF